MSQFSTDLYSFVQVLLWLANKTERLLKSISKFVLRTYLWFRKKRFLCFLNSRQSTLSASLAAADYWRPDTWTFYRSISLDKSWCGFMGSFKESNWWVRAFPFQTSSIAFSMAGASTMKMSIFKDHSEEHVTQVILLFWGDWRQREYDFPTNMDNVHTYRGKTSIVSLIF